MTFRKDGWFLGDSRKEQQLGIILLILPPLNSGIANLSNVFEELLASKTRHRTAASILLTHINTAPDLNLVRLTVRKKSENMLLLVRGCVELIIFAGIRAGGIDTPRGRRATINTLTASADLFYEIEANAGDHPGVPMPDFLRSAIFDDRENWAVDAVRGIVEAATEDATTPMPTEEIECLVDDLGHKFGNALFSITSVLSVMHKNYLRRKSKQSAAVYSGVS